MPRRSRRTSHRPAIPPSLREPLVADLFFQRAGVVVLPLIVAAGAFGLLGDTGAHAGLNLVVRAALVYAMVWLVFRISGRRTFAEMNTFDLVLILIVSEATQQALIGDDKTISGATVVVATLAFMDVAALRITSRSKVLDRWIDGVPALLVHEGRPLTQRMRRLRVSLDDVLESARREQGVQCLDRIRLAVLERDGSISIVTRDESIDEPSDTPGGQGQGGRTAPTRMRG